MPSLTEITLFTFMSRHDVRRACNNMTPKSVNFASISPCRHLLSFTKAIGSDTHRQTPPWYPSCPRLQNKTTATIMTSTTGAGPSKPRSPKKQKTNNAGPDLRQQECSSCELAWPWVIFGRQMDGTRDARSCYGEKQLMISCMNISVFDA